MGMKMKRGSDHLAILVYLIQFLSICIMASSQCKNGPIIFNFGDSNSDTGSTDYGLGQTILPPNGRTFFHKPSGRPCDGRLILDFLCECVKTNYLTPYLEPMGPNFTNGANFALSGAAILSRPKPYNIDVQVAQFIHFRSRSAFLSSKGYKDMVCNESFSKALYMIDIGQNDLAASFLNLTYQQVVEKIPLFITEFKKTIKILHDQGARNFWIHNTGPLGCVPLMLTLIQHSSVDLDQNGCHKAMNDASIVFNDKLRVMSEELRSELTDVVIVYVDIHAIKLDLILNAANYGFEDPFMACCGYGGPPYNFDFKIQCGQNGSTVCKEGLKYNSWDGVHLTEAANQFIASKILSSLYSNPPINLNHFFNS